MADDQSLVVVEGPVADANSKPIVEDSAKKPFERASSIIYKIEWEDDKSEARQNFESEVSFGPLGVSTENVDHHLFGQNTSGSKAPLEIVTQIWGRSDYAQRDGSSKEDPTATPEQMSRGVVLKDIKISKVGKTRIIIRSQPLLEIIRGCVTYYPGTPITGDEVELHEPYPLLIHHLDKLEETQRRLETNNELHKHLKSMLDYLKGYMEPRINAAMKKLEKPKPLVSFDMLSLLLIPGLDAYWQPPIEHFSDTAYAAVIMKTESRKVIEEDSEREKEALQIFLWSLESDGRNLGRDSFCVDILRYEGERQVTSLEAYPCKYLDAEDGGKTREAMIDRGHKAYHLLRAIPRQMKYSGLTNSKQKREYHGTCVIDTVTYLSQKGKDADTDDMDWDFLEDELTVRSYNSDMSSQALSDFVFAHFHHIDIASTPSLPTDRHYFLMSPFIPGLALYNKTWRIFNVELLEEIQTTMEMDSLIIDPVNRDIVQAITYAHSDSFKFDHTHSKGEGHVVLLHGPPGVGKTYTVECIAQSTGRPLISLTMGDLMSDNRDIYQELMKWFTLSERWDAILLLDEADIFLEKRAQKDIQRNGVVSIFLRRMEYFRGLLFLTTNRVGQIDDAFLSRVSVVLQYNPLNDDTRKKIWQNFFKKLQKEAEKGGKKIEVTKYARQYVLGDPAVRNLQWNGREIRNALQTAISLATYKAYPDRKNGEELVVVDVDEEHFQSVVAMSQKFRDYMRGITGRDEEQRARARLDRTGPIREPYD